MPNDDRSRNRDRGAGAPDEAPELDFLEVGEDSELIELEETSRRRASIKVVGVGGGGGNALNSMIEGGLSGVDFICANTDAQAMKHNLAPVKVQLGIECARGLGSGARPDVGKAAALEARERLQELLADTDMVFVTAGLGGGTGTGAAPVIAEVARELGALTVAVVTRPFAFEGRVRARHAEQGIEELHRVVDTLITIPNQRLLSVAGKGARLKDAFRLADDVLFNAVKGISDLITVHGLINLDFADVRTIMNEMGMALMGTGVGRGENRAVEAAQAAISSPLLEDLSIEGARGVLINITGCEDMTLFEVNEASSLIQEAAHEDANIIFGAVVDESLPEGEMRVTVIATGLDDGRARRGRDRFEEAERERLAYANVTRLKPRAAEFGNLPAAERGGAEPRAEQPRPSLEEELRAEGLASPYDEAGGESEYDTPTFMRRGKRLAHEDDDTDSPAFLRRSAD